jgi:hypothetical protein
MTYWESVYKGPIKGYCSAGRNNGRGRYFMPKRALDYAAWKLAFRASVGRHFPETLDLKATYRLDIVVAWRLKCRVDRVNVAKAVEDALFFRDRRILNGDVEQLEHTGVEAIHVLLTKVTEPSRHAMAILERIRGDKKPSPG